MRKARVWVLMGVAGAMVAGPFGGSAHGLVVDADPAVIVVGDPAALTVGDSVLIAELADLGYSVQAVDDAATASTSATMVVVAPSVNSTTIGSKYSNTTAAVLTLNALTWQNFGLTTAVGSVFNTSNLLVIDGGSPIVDGLDSTFAVSTTADPLGSVNTAYVPSTVDTVVARANNSSAAVVLSLTSGGTRSDSTPAPAGRIGMGLTDSALDSLTDDGYQLIDNAVSWVSNQAGSQALQAATLHTAGRWNLDDKSTFSSNLPSTNRIKNGIVEGKNGTFPAFALTGTAATSVKENQTPVTKPTGHSFYFPGWHNLTPGPCPNNSAKTCDTVPASASLATIPDYDPLSLPTSNKLSPGVAPTTGSATKVYWSLTVDIRADPLTVETDDPHWDESKASNPDGFGPASPNIIQQGKASAGGQWKLSQHPVSGRSDIFTVSCDFEDLSDGFRTVNMGNLTRLSAGRDYRITCGLLTGGIPKLTISDSGGLVDTQTATTYSPSSYTVLPSDDVFLGKKSSQSNSGGASNTHANDAYAGFIDNIQIKTSHS